MTKDWVYACDKANALVPTAPYELTAPPALSPQPSSVVTLVASTGSHSSTYSQPHTPQRPFKRLRAAGKAAAEKIQRTSTLDHSGSDSDTQPMETMTHEKKQPTVYRKLSDSDSDTIPMTPSAAKPLIRPQDITMHVSSDSGSDTEPMADDTTPSTVPPPAPPPTPLPSFFEGMHFVLLGSFSVQQKRLMNRYITAYNG